MIRPIDNIYRQGLNMVAHKGGVSFWYNVDDYLCIPLPEEFVETAIEEKVLREWTIQSANEGIKNENQNHKRSIP